MASGAATGETRGRPFLRSATAALLAAVTATAGHVAGAGNLSTATPMVLSVLGIAAGSTGLALWSNALRRRCWEALALLWLGQLGVETLLVCDGGELDRPLAAACVHVAAGPLVGLLLMGGRRLLDDASAALDVLLPRCWADPTRPTSLDRVACLSAGPVVLRAQRRAGGRRVRGPPRPA
ncbi:hypothetical protein ACQPX6_08535 [Actinomycetospora sp. CA-101289]|uniref:hypothetical protein n=1 Tax=Actinomycetospora sp. CA-101289 TaxID=3239893 RepID=UPI003D98E9DD